jgi:hypothetical protein
MNHLGVAVLIAVFAAAVPVNGQPRTGPAPSVEPTDIAPLTGHPALRASLARLWHGSPSFRAALVATAQTGRQVVLLTPDQVIVRDHAASLDSRPFDRDVLAEASPVLDGEGGVSSVLVVINLPLIESLHERRGSLPGEVQVDLDRLVAHEVFGHALPYLMAGSLAGRCADPVPGQRATDACAIQRENIVREELGLSRRTDGGLQSLMLAFPGRH